MSFINVATVPGFRSLAGMVAVMANSKDERVCLEWVSLILDRENNATGS